MSSLIKSLFHNKFNADKKYIYTFYLTAIVGIASILIFGILAIYHLWIAGFPLTIDEFRLLIIPFISILSLVLLISGLQSIAKMVFLFGTLFVFSYFPVFCGAPTVELLILNPILLITYSALAQIIFHSKSEKYYLIISSALLLALLISFDFIYALSDLSITFTQIVGYDYFAVKMAYVFVMIVIDSLVIYSVRLNERIQSELDSNNKELDNSRLELLNQNLKLKKFQSEILQQNKSLEEYTEELLSQNEMIDNQGRTLDLNWFYTHNIKNLLNNERDDIHSFFKEFFIYEKPKKTVSSDFFWSRKIDQKVFFVLGNTNVSENAAVLLSIVGLKLLNNVIRKSDDLEDLYHQFWVESEKIKKNSPAPWNMFERLFDIGFACVNLSNYSCKLIHNGIDVFIIRDEHVLPIKPIKTDSLTKGQVLNLELRKGDKFYLATDGIKLQNNDEEQSPLGEERLSQVLTQISKVPFDLQGDRIQQFIEQWIGKSDQNDDITVLGLEI